LHIRLKRGTECEASTLSTGEDPNVFSRMVDGRGKPLASLQGHIESLSEMTKRLPELLSAFINEYIKGYRITLDITIERQEL